MLPHLSREKDGRVSEELCASAAAMANALGAAAIFVYTRRGFMANFLSRQRPDCPIFAFTGTLGYSQGSLTVPSHDLSSSVAPDPLSGTGTRNDCCTADFLSWQRPDCPVFAFTGIAWQVIAWPESAVRPPMLELMARLA